MDEVHIPEGAERRVLNSSLRGGQSIHNQIQMGEQERSPVNTVLITPANYGFIVKIGCQTFAIESVEKLTKNLRRYLSDPSDVERAWLKKKYSIESATIIPDDLPDDLPYNQEKK